MGESGTGKELASSTIHELSRRREAPFLPLNCGAVAPQLIESELFGHERGSFTGADRQHKGFFERANGGTIFLDEITEMPMELQVKLLRVLETGSFMRVGGTSLISTDVRVVAATNREPEKAVADGKLREDLYHRLNVFPIRLPPLRERGTDIEQLAQYFLDELNRIEGTTKSFSRDALVRLYQHNWPGNVRELRNYVQRAYIMADDVIECDVAVSDPTPKSDDGTTITIRVGTPLEEVERRVTMATLVYCGHVKRKAAEILGVRPEDAVQPARGLQRQGRARWKGRDGPCRRCGRGSRIGTRLMNHAGAAAGFSRPRRVFVRRFLHARRLHCPRSSPIGSFAKLLRRLNLDTYACYTCCRCRRSPARPHRPEADHRIAARFHLGGARRRPAAKRSRFFAARPVTCSCSICPPGYVRARCAPADQDPPRGHRHAGAVSRIPKPSTA